MPIVNIDLAWLNRLLGKPYPTETLRESLEQIGCDVEDIVDIERSRCPQCGSLVEHPLGQDEVKVCTICSFESEVPFKRAGRQQVMRLDLLADRPDLFDVGGLARALRGTLGIETGLPKYATKPSGLTVKVDNSVTDKSSYRPFIACAVMTLPPVDETSLVAIMKLQENLHWGVGRDRKLASIGVYDMSAISGDITYRTIDPDNEPFTPLGMPGRKMTGRQILESHPKGTAYAELLANHMRYPVLVDSKNHVLSMPPIINSEETKLKQRTTRVFIDVTGISQAAVTKSLDTLVCSLAEIGGTIETVTIIDADGKERNTPDLTPRTKQIDIAEARRWLGLSLDNQSLTSALQKMRFDVILSRADSAPGFSTHKSPAPSLQPLTVSFPAYRTDIRHMVDLFEDVAIGYGYTNIEPRLVRSMTVGAPRPEESLSDRVRQVLIGLGFSEIMSLPLTTEAHQFERLRIPVPAHYPQVANPKLKAYNVVRTNLMGGLLEALRENRRRPMPIRLFEIDNVVDLDDAAETGAAETRNLALVEIGRESGYATARSTIDALLRELGWDAEYTAIEHPTFVPGRAASFSVNDQPIGILGEVHPEVLINFGLTYPVALAELTLQRVF
ncbi:MAG TPA: phenylalanine--tRNA ligase subunit beta [Lacipirellulaceae bacterium]|nr:phenylalanine--tRNA ligase subunit beta [Lacipirellulaceae bacterium]